MKIKDHMTLIIISSVTLVLGLIGFYLMSSAKSGLAAAQNELLVLRARLNPVIESKPFPSLENIKALENNQKSIVDARQQFLDYFNNPDIIKENPEPIQLRNMIVEFRQGMTALAKKEGVQLPKDYAFSFDAYTQGLPDKRNTEILAKQLSTLEVILSMAFKSRIQELKSVERAALIDEKPPAGSKAGTLKITTDEALGFQRIPFEISFVGDIHNLRDMINKMAQSRNLFVVKDVIIKNHNLKVSSLQHMMTAEALEMQKNSSAPIIIFGLEKLMVTIRFDLLVFNAPPQIEQKGGAK